MPEASAHTQTTTPTPTPTRTHPHTAHTTHPPTHKTSPTHPPTHPHKRASEHPFPRVVMVHYLFFFCLKKRIKSYRPEPGRDVPPRDARADASPVVSLRCIRQNTPASVSTSNNIPSILLHMCPETEAHGSRSRSRSVFSPSSTFVSSYFVIRMLTYADVYVSSRMLTYAHVCSREDR